MEKILQSIIGKGKGLILLAIAAVKLGATFALPFMIMAALRTVAIHQIWNGFLSNNSSFHALSLLNALGLALLVDIASYSSLGRSSTPGVPSKCSIPCLPVAGKSISTRPYRHGKN